MIEVLGFKRITLLLVVFAVNAAFLIGIFGYAKPEKSLRNNQLNLVDSQVSVLKSDIERMQIQLSQLEEQKEEFEMLEEEGFFDRQDRRRVAPLLERIQVSSEVVAAIANIAKIEIEENEEADKAGQRILVSPLNIKLEAMDDLDVFRYIYLLEQTFPGHLTVESLSLFREANVTKKVLQAIANGRKPTLVRADITMLWRTMIPEEYVGGLQQER